jgi:hypothetical protein
MLNSTCLSCGFIIKIHDIAVLEKLLKFGNKLYQTAGLKRSSLSHPLHVKCSDRL